VKLSLSTDFGAPHHWRRLVDFAREHGVGRLVFWGDYSSAGFAPPWLFPQYPDLLTDEERARRERVRERMAGAAAMCREAGIEFWYCYQVLMLSSRFRDAVPGMFNEYGEPDMAGDAVYELLRAQVGELLELAPGLAGIELWVMECAQVVISRLAHQSISLREICRRVVDTVHGECRRAGLEMSVDLHTAGGHRPMLDGLLGAARNHPDIMVSGDNVIGDFHVHLPFNSHLERAAEHNRALVHFDLSGEYWGRSFLPTCALGQYRRHLDAARAVGAVCVDGRISTGHDASSPHVGLLPSRRRLYPAAGRIRPAEPLPRDIEVCCFDTLWGFNAECFCRYVKDSGADALEAVQGFVRREFGEGAEGLALVLADVERVAARVHYSDSNYFGPQSLLPARWHADFWAMDVHMTTPAGEPFPPADGLGEAGLFGGGRAQFAGWPVPVGHRAAGPQAIIAEKRSALADAEDLLARAGDAAAGLEPEHRAFILRPFEDFVLFARAAAALTEAMVHYFHIRLDRESGDIPDRKRLRELVSEMKKVAGQWAERQPHDEWKVRERLGEWCEEMTSRA